MTCYTARLHSYLCGVSQGERDSTTQNTHELGGSFSLGDNFSFCCRWLRYDHSQIVKQREDVYWFLWEE